MMLSLWTDNNRLLAPIMVIAATAIISFGLSYLALRLGDKARNWRRVEIHAGEALAHLETQLRACEATVETLNTRLVSQKVAISQMILHMNKALSAAASSSE